MKAKALTLSVLSAGAILFAPAMASAGVQLVTPAVVLNQTLNAKGTATPVYYRYGKSKRGGFRLHFGGFRGGYHRHRGFGKYKFGRRGIYRSPYYGYGRYRPYSYGHGFRGHGAFGRYGGS